MTATTSMTDLIDTAIEQGGEDAIAFLEAALRQVRNAKAALDTTWESAVEEFITSKRAKTRDKTIHYYRTQLTVLVRWCEDQSVTLHKFLVWRKTEGGRRGKAVAPGTLYHDQIAATAFFKFCSSRGLVQRNPLAGYKVEKGPKVSIAVPTEQELVAVLEAIPKRYDARQNEDVRYLTLTLRRFYQTRDYAIIAGLVDTGMRIGEMLALTLNDFDLEARKVTIRESKTKQPRTVPISQEWGTLLDAWLKVRAKAGVDTNLLFYSHTGEAISVSYYGKHFQKFVQYAGVKKFTPHAIRHFTLTKFAKRSTLAAKSLAGHGSLKTTQIYAESDGEHNRAIHEAAAPLAGILGKPTATRQRKPRVVG